MKIKNKGLLVGAAIIALAILVLYTTSSNQSVGPSTYYCDIQPVPQSCSISLSIATIAKGATIGYHPVAVPVSITSFPSGYPILKIETISSGPVVLNGALTESRGTEIYEYKTQATSLYPSIVGNFSVPAYQGNFTYNLTIKMN
jgi:hypothetical protein